MKKVILYVDGPRILSKRIFFIFFIVPIIAFIFIFHTNTIFISDIERIKIDDSFVYLKIRKEFEKAYFYKENQKDALLYFIYQDQIQKLIN